MNKNLKNVIVKISENSGQDLSQKFLRRISSNIPLTKETSPTNHFCAFFVPVNLESKSIYLGHHIKANSWIPPGGHIKSDEDPQQTVIREFKEELDYDIGKKQITFFDMSIKRINNPRTPCKIHYDIWYYVEVPKINYKFLKKEFYEARWFTFKEAKKQIKIPVYTKIIQKIKSLV